VHCERERYPFSPLPAKGRARGGGHEASSGRAAVSPRAERERERNGKRGGKPVGKFTSAVDGP